MTKTAFSAHSSLPIVKDSGILLSPDNRRVLLRPYLPDNQSRIERITACILALDEDGAGKWLAEILNYFSGRHRNFADLLEKHFETIRPYLPSNFAPSRAQKQLIGAYFLAEYSYESAALFNPSIVPHPDQTGVPEGGLRFILSLRATGEGHISSLTFCAGLVDPAGHISIDPSARFASAARMEPESRYDKICFMGKLYEMGFANGCSKAITGSLPDQFTITELQKKINDWHAARPSGAQDRLTTEKILWLAQCNYEASFDPKTPLAERVLFPLAPSEENGIEDARFVLFANDDGSKKYYATYTAYDGKNILPQIMETGDFIHFKMITLNGKAALNKGMALFPRRINGRYAMISRIDNENLFLMYSDNIHFWHEAAPLMKPLYPWEFMKIGNCGSPIETEKGWILLTHGVGSLRQYSIGAVLLDRENPARIIGRLREPLISWYDSGFSGYVPNVVYSCGALAHGSSLVIPYALSDNHVRIAQVAIDDLVSQIRAP